MEDADGFIRTIPEDFPAYETDDNASQLEFDSDDDDDGDKRTQPFFTAERPVPWNMKAAHQHAEKPLSFQTSIDQKIDSTLRKMQTDHPDTAADDDDDDNDKDDKGSKNQKPQSPPSDDDDDDEDDEAHQPAAEHASDEQDALPKKGKKRIRREKNAPTSFLQLHLSKPLQKAVDVLEWIEPTPIQAAAIPYILSGRDVCASAVTGSGKTAAFVLPILERLLQAGFDNATRVVILLPTRELAAQCHSVLTTLAKYTTIRAALAVGGLSNKAQEAALRSRPHIVVATPGRLIDHIRNAQSFSLDDIEILVMDEADRLLEMGFQAEVEQIVRYTPASRQTLLFSATINSKLKSLIKLSLQNPINLAVDAMFDVASTLSQEFVKLKPAFESNKDAILFSLVTRTFKSRTIIFFRQKVTAHRFKILFGLTKLKCAELHGNLTQAQRLEALDSFREGGVDFLLCTDLAARGLDIAAVDTVINYDMPPEVKEYVHRVGRTARAGNQGRACSIVCTGNNEERKLLKDVAKRAKGQLSARVVPVAVIGKWRVWIDSLEGAVKSVLKEEKQEMEMRKAEMELRKAGNIMQHSDDIYGRPARTWFQSEAQKMETKSRVREQLGLEATAEEQKRTERRKRKAADMEKRRKGQDKTKMDRDVVRQKADARSAKRKAGKRS